MPRKHEFDITDALIEVAWKHLPSPYEIDIEDRIAMVQMLNAIFEATQEITCRFGNTKEKYSD